MLLKKKKREVTVTLSLSEEELVVLYNISQGLDCSLLQRVYNRQGINDLYDKQCGTAEGLQADIKRIREEVLD